MKKRRKAAVFTLFFVLSGLIFIIKPKNDDVLPKEWWTAKIEDTENGFKVVWYAQHWREMSPQNMPALWLMPVRSIFGLVLVLPILAAVYDLAHDGDGPFKDPVPAAFVTVFFLTFYLIVSALWVIPLKRFEPSKIWFSKDGVSYDPPPSARGHPGASPGGGYFGHGDLTIGRRNITEVRLEPDAVVISAPPFLGCIPLHMRIPDNPPEIGDRVTEWARRYNRKVVDDRHGT